jgi:hypothetical protein
MAAKRMGRLVVHLVHRTWPRGVLPLPRPRQMAKGLKALFDWSCT